MQNLLLSFQVGTVSISADPRHLTEEIFIIYLINNSSCTTLTLSDLKMTALPSFSAATLRRRHSNLTKDSNPMNMSTIPPYTATNTQNSFHSHQHTHTQETLNISLGNWRCINQSFSFFLLKLFLSHSLFLLLYFLLSSLQCFTKSLLPSSSLFHFHAGLVVWMINKQLGARIKSHLLCLNIWN